jgi:hypothetical protein
MTRARINDAGVPALAIRYAVTEDNFNGEPWMPDGADFWALVGRVRGHRLTMWRNVGITTTEEKI